MRRGGEEELFFSNDGESENECSSRTDNDLAHDDDIEDDVNQDKGAT